MKSCVMAGWLMTVSVGNAIVVVFAEARLTDNMVRMKMLFSLCFDAIPKFDVKGATSRFVHLEKIFQVGHLQSVPILSILNHPRSLLVYYYFFGVFLSYQANILWFPSR